MATKVIGTAHELTAKIWAEGLEAEALQKISVADFVGKGSDAVLQHRDRLESEPGDVERVGLRMQETTAPKTSGQSVEGAEKTLRLKYMDVTLDEFAEAFRWDNIMSRQRVTFEHREEAKAALSDLLANAWDVSFFNQLTGFADPGGASTFEGNNPITAPEAAKHVILGGGTEAQVADTDDLTLDTISLLKYKAKTGAVPIRKARIPGYPESLYVVFVHPGQNLRMRQNDSEWDSLWTSAMRGGMIGDNPVITAASCIWDECLIVENTRVPLVDTTLTNVRRAVLCGAQTGMCVYGRLGGSPERYRWVEKLFDFDREMGVLGGFVGGLVKSTFADENGGGNVIDYATIVCSTASES